MKIPQSVYELLGVEPETKDKKWPGGVINFYDIPYKDIKKIAEILGEEFLNECQNHSPTVREFLKELEPYEDCTYFHGYVVSPFRSDERVTIEAVTTAKTDETILLYRMADDFNFTDDDLLYAWWD